MFDKKCLKALLTKDEEFILNCSFMKFLLFAGTQGMCKVLDEEADGEYFMREKIHDYFMITTMIKLLKKIIINKYLFMILDDNKIGIKWSRNGRMQWIEKIMMR